jgi:Putative sensor
VAKPSKSTNGFFGVILNPQSYLNMVYLLAAFPLGTFYFVFLVTGLSLGAGLSITLLGIPILGVVFASTRALCAVERRIANAVLKARIPLTSEREHVSGLWNHFKALLKDRTTWVGMLYLFIKFPLGIVTFTVTVTFISASLALIGTPIVYPFVDIDFVFWQVTTWQGTLIFSLFGILLLFVSFHLLNGLALVSARLAKMSLGKR